MSLLGGFFGSDSNNGSGGIFDTIFGNGGGSGNPRGGSTYSGNSNAYKPLFGSGGTYDDQTRPAGSQYIINGTPCNNE